MLQLVVSLSLHGSADAMRGSVSLRIQSVLWFWYWYLSSCLPLLARSFITIAQQIASHVAIVSIELVSE